LGIAAGATAHVQEWTRILADLAVDELSLLAGAEESRGRLRCIRLVDRLTPHVRHRTKYLDVPVSPHHGFVFSRRGEPTGDVARTLKEFIDILGRTVPESIEAHVQHGDFSMWIAGVFGDRQLAAHVRHLEENYRLHRIGDINDAVADAIRSRYAFTQPPP
jgi:hypothetical protein